MWFRQIFFFDNISRFNANWTQYAFIQFVLFKKIPERSIISMTNGKSRIRI